MTNPFFSSEPGFNKLMIFGSGGHGRELAWLARQCYGESVEIFFAVSRPEFFCDEVNGIPVRMIDDCASIGGERYIVALGDPKLRRKAVGLCADRGFRPGVLVHPRVEASETVILGPGSVVCAGTILTVNLEIGAHVHINVGCSISHDVVIGDFCTLSPGVRVCGNVIIGEGVFIGVGASVINGHSEAPLVVGDGAVIAAGACVTRSIEAGAMVAGVPAMRKR